MKDIIKKYLHAENDDLIPIIRGIKGSTNISDIKESNVEPLCFIDGGSCVFFQTPSLCIGKARIAKVWMNGKKKLKHEIKDYDIIAYYDNGWQAQVNNEVLKISDKDVQEFNRENISRIIGVVRRYLELKATSNDICILDGSLDETSELDKSIVLKDNVLGLAKTNSIRTTQGNSYTYLLNKNKMPFIAKNVIENVSFVKLSNTPYVFRIDGKLSDNVLYSLKINSEDPEFKGYPYGLFLADKLARIPDYEQKAMKVKLFQQFGTQEFRELLASNDAHDFLDMQNIY